VCRRFPRVSCHHVGSTNRPAAAPRLCVRSCLSIRSCVNVQSRAQKKCRRCHATRFPDEDSWLRLNLHRIPTLSRRGVARGRAPAPPRGPPRRRGARGAACGGTRQLAPRSRRTRSPSRFGEAWAAQGADNLLTYLLPGPHRAVCAQTGVHAAPPGRTRTRVHTWPRATRRGAAGVARPRRRSTGRETARVRRATLVACNRILVPAFFSAGAWGLTAPCSSHE
jgi:hypothetical protein